MLNKKSLQLAGEARRWIIFSAVVLFLKGLVYVVQVFAVAWILDGFVFADIEVAQIVIFAGVTAGLICAKFGLSLLEARFSFKISAIVKTSVRSKIFTKVKQLGPGYTESSGTAALVTNAVDGVESMEVFFGRFVPQFFYSLIIPLVLLAIGSFINPVCSAVLLAAVPIIPLSMVFISKWAKRSMGNFWDGYQDLSATFLDNLQGMVTLKLFNKSEKRLQEMEAQAWGFRNSTMNLLKMQLTSITVMDTLVYGFAGLGIGVVLLYFFLGKISFFGAIVLLLLSVEFFLPLRKLGSYFHAGVNGIQAGKKINAFLETEPSVKDCGKVVASQGFDIVFDNVSFSYNREKENLRNVNFCFEQGKIYGIVGESGCGKTSLAHLILRFFEVKKGEIRLGGCNIADIPLNLLRQRVNLVTNSSAIFSGSIADNLRLGKADASSQQMVDVCNKVGLFHLIDTPDGLEKSVGEAGAMLSGGERQRLALARALLYDAQVYIFDEITGSVDAESEKIIKETIYSLRGEKTVLIISHRKAIVEGADDIVTIKNGEIVGQQEVCCVG
ncbi:MAG: ABC transporter ATP-binding protein/permease [Spirochaetales bacterium]|nr:ABC transporter ATP-binding protein/permease [Spirochaetales bacterium]